MNKILEIIKNPFFLGICFSNLVIVSLWILDLDFDLENILENITGMITLFLLMVIIFYYLGFENYTNETPIYHKRWFISIVGIITLYVFYLFYLYLDDFGFKDIITNQIYSIIIGLIVTFSFAIFYDLYLNLNYKLFWSLVKFLFWIVLFLSILGSLLVIGQGIIQGWQETQYSIIILFFTVPGSLISPIVIHYANKKLLELKNNDMNKEITS